MCMVCARVVNVVEPSLPHSAPPSEAERVHSGETPFSPSHPLLNHLRILPGRPCRHYCACISVSFSAFVPASVFASIKALSRLYQGYIQALLMLFKSSCVYVCVCVCVCVCVYVCAAGVRHDLLQQLFSLHPSPLPTRA